MIRTLPIDAADHNWRPSDDQWQQRRFGQWQLLPIASPALQYAEAISLLAKHLFQSESLEDARLKPHYFTRNRPLSFPTVLPSFLPGVQGAVRESLIN